jgi:hypothetical protein
MLKAAVASSTLGDAREVRDFLREVDRAADLTGDRNDYWLAFGPANVRIHRAWLALELGDPIDALEKAAAVDLERLPSGVAERAGSHLITVAVAHRLRHQDAEAVAALKQVRLIAPEMLLFTHRVREMLRGLTKREKPSFRRDLRELTAFVGLE